LESLQDRHKVWNPSGKPLSRSQRYIPHVSASRPNSFSRCAEPPPRPPNRSRHTASRRGRSPAPLGQRAGGLQCSRLHSGVCSHSPHLLPARSRLPRKSQFTQISYLASASPSPTSAGQCGLPRRAGRGQFPIWADAVSTGCARRGRDDALLDAVPDAVGLALQRPGQLGDLHHGPEIGGDRGLGVLELPVVIEESLPEHLGERVELVAPAVAAEIAGILGRPARHGRRRSRGWCCDQRCRGRR
jgi:hypothetical protein